MNASQIQALLTKAVIPTTLTEDGHYTMPRSWGVYNISQTKSSATKLYRFGNHPIRQRELSSEFGAVAVVALFTSRSLAAELSKLLNAGHS